MAGAVVGIDLGTTNTVVAVVRGGKATVLADEEGHRLLPSVVSFHPNGEVLVGHKARERRLVDARNTIYSVKRLIGRSWQSEEVDRARQRFPFELREGPTHGPLVVARKETYTLPEISAFVLRRAKQIAENALGEPVERAVVTVPASFNDLQRASTKVAAREAGLEVLRILNEPTAAALAYGFGKSGNERIAIYDFGGGTFDLTLLDLSGNVFEVIATAGDSFLGGDDVDHVIADRMAQDVIRQTRFDPRVDVQVMERLRAAAEQVKVALSSQQEMSIELKELGYGLGGASIDLNFRMNRVDLENLAGSLIDRTFTVCRDAMQLARLQVDAFDNVILVGGSTRIPAVRRKVEQFFAKRPMDRVNPDEVVAIGAAIQAAALTGAERRRNPTPAPIANPDAVKATRIQTLGGVGKDRDKDPLRASSTGARAPIAPPPARTTGRIVTAPLQADATTPEPVPAHLRPSPGPSKGSRTDAQRADAASGLRLFEEALQDTSSKAQRHPGLPAQDHSYPDIPGAVGSGNYPAMPGAVTPGRPVTQPLIPMSRPYEPPQAKAERETGPNFDFEDVTTTGGGMPQAFPDHSPVPVPLKNIGAVAEQSAPFYAPPSAFDLTPPPQRVAPVKATAIAMTPPPPQVAPSSPPPAAVSKATAMAFAPPAAPPPTPLPTPSPFAVPSVLQQYNQQPTQPAPQQARAAPSMPPLPGPQGAARGSMMPSWPPPQMGAEMQIPLLIDVTPLTLAVETVGGFVDRVIARNTPVPCSQTRTFTTSKDGQSVVKIRVCQGEGESFRGNTSLGELELSGLRAARRGEVSIEVTFELDADGILQVRARDLETQRQTAAQMKLVGMDS